MDTGLGDIASLDPESLLLPDLPSLDLKTNSQIAEDLFSQWLSRPDTGRLVKSLIDDAKAGFSFNASGNPSSSPLAGSASPLSPRNPSSSTLELVNEPLQEVIPQFYFQNGRPPSEELKEQCMSRLNDLFNPSIDRLQVDEFKTVTKEICKLPSFFSSVLFRKIDSECTGIVTRDAFVKYWVETNMLTMDIATLIFKILKQSDCNYLTQADFKPILRELLATHEGLELMQGKPELQDRYAETVIYRIFYYINRSGNGCLTLRELKRGNLIAAMQHVDEEVDIDKVLKYFSYQHFFVISYTFRELDTDNDFLIDKEDLKTYGNCALSAKVIDRIFSQVPRKFTSNVNGMMGFEDFVYFLLAEEDKSSEPSLEYWFKCIDLDGNGVLTANEMQYFYDEQICRMMRKPHEPIVFFDDILCQIIDMIAPERKDCITLLDLKRSKLSGNVFNLLFNLDKFRAFETYGLGLFRQVVEDPSLTEWDCFAHEEYIRLSILYDSDSDSDSEEDSPDGTGVDLDE